MERDQFFTLSPDLLATASADGFFRELNPAWTRCLGWSLDELRARPWIEFVHPDDVARTLALRQGTSADEAIHFENRYRHKDGTYKWLSWSATRRVDGNAYLIARDVTDAKRTEAALRASEQRLRDLFENATDVNYTQDLNGNFTAINRAVETLTGYTHEEILHMNGAQLMAPDDVEQTRRRVAEVGLKRMEGTYTMALITKDGRRVPVEISTRLLYDGTRPVGVQGVARDLTERRAAEREQRRLSEVLDATTDLVAICNTDGRVLFYNRAGRLMLGIGESEDVTQRSALESMSPAELERMQQEMQTVDRDGVWSGELDVLSRDGREIPLSAVVLAHRTRSGRIEAYSTIGRDISEQKRAEAELRARGERLREEAEISAALVRVGSELLSAVATPVLLDRLTRQTAETLDCDASHVFLWDPDISAYVAKSSYGALPEEREALAVTSYPLAVVAPLQAAIERGEIAHVLYSDAPAKLQKEVLDTYQVKAILVVALRRGTDIIGVLTAINRTREERFTILQQRIVQGIAQLGSFALENARLFDELERANRFRSDFVATMSHELRTPMSVILGYHELLLDGAFGPLAPAQADTLTRAHRSAAELLDLVNATLDLSRLETRRVPLALQDVTVARLLEDVAAEIGVPPEKADLRVFWNPPPDGLVVRTDPVKARMVLKNLVVNAIKFTERGRVTVAAHARGGGVEFTVTDTGIGIAPEARRVIFEPFRQLDTGPARRAGGAGLGLYIVRRLLVALGGTIAVESALGQGATFRVWLPPYPAAESDGRAS